MERKGNSQKPVMQQTNGNSMENYGGAGSPFCGATMGGRCKFGSDDICRTCKKTRQEKQGPKPTTNSSQQQSVPQGRQQAPGTKPAPKKKTAEDYECPVCLCICAEPVMAPCKHFFCLQCIKGVKQMGMTCPLCRAEFDNLFVPVIDRSLQQEIMQVAGEEFEERKQELIEEGSWRGNKKPLTFAFGNTHSLVAQPKESRSKSGTKNSHRWTMFVALNGDKEQTQKYIKKVTYHLHPTFKPNKIEIVQAPFLLARVGWGYFEIEMDVEFQKSTGMKPVRLTHELNFDGKGKTQSFEMEVQEDDGGEETIEQLTKQFEKMEAQAKKKN